VYQRGPFGHDADLQHAAQRRDRAHHPDFGQLQEPAEVQTDVVPDRPAAADAAELRITLLDALGHLSPRDRAIIVLRYWEDHSVQTVAELLNLSPGVVKMQSMRALASLRVLLGEDEALPAPPA
jgi:RNA polymerase sigma factor (sigma-70 family)